MYAVRQKKSHLLPHETAPAVAIFETYKEAAQDADRRVKRGENGIHITGF